MPIYLHTKVDINSQYNHQSMWYYIALLQREDILSKGVGKIYHRFPEAYYQCLCRLPHLSEFSTRDKDLHHFQNKHFLAVQKGKSLPDLTRPDLGAAGGLKTSLAPADEDDEDDEDMPAPPYC